MLQRRVVLTGQQGCTAELLCRFAVSHSDAAVGVYDRARILVLV